MKELEKLFDERMQKKYDEIVEAIGVSNLAIIHLKHATSFVVKLDKLEQKSKKEQILSEIEFLENLQREDNSKPYYESQISGMISKRLEVLKKNGKRKNY